MNSGHVVLATLAYVLRSQLPLILVLFILALLILVRIIIALFIIDLHITELLILFLLFRTVLARFLSAQLLLMQLPRNPPILLMQFLHLQLIWHLTNLLINQLVLV